MRELSIFARSSVGARALLREYLDQPSVIATLKVDPEATRLAGKDVYRDEPTENLLACHAAVLAAYRDDFPVCTSHKATHPQTAATTAQVHQ